jgi:dihydrolipoamide dehydrogenase
MNYDLIVIGAGPGGYETAIHSGKNGLKTLLVEKAKLGGVCLNSGCIPTKTLLHSVHAYKHISSFRMLGITVKEAEIDYEKVIARKDRLVARLIKGIEKQLSDANVKVIHGEATLDENKTVKINNNEYTAKDIIIATGSKPIEIPGITVDHKKYFNSTSILNLKELPKSITIIGSGYIGLEFADMFSSLGVKVTITEMMGEILPAFDQEAVDLVVSKLKKQGCSFNLNTKFEAATDESEIVLCSVGRKPFANAFAETVELGKRGEIIVDENYKTSLDNVYAIGDVNCKAMLAHAATFQGLKVVDMLIGKTNKINIGPIPSVMFTSPQIAQVGNINGENLAVKKESLMMLGKAQAENNTEGFVKLFYDKKTNIIEGAIVVSEIADALIGEALVLVNKQVTINELSNMIHPHPTMSEIFFEAVK